MIKPSALEFHLQHCETKICLFCSFPFSLKIIKEHQVKCQQEKNELLLLKEMERCPYCKEDIPLSFLDKHEKTCKILKENKEKN
jgi:hypothetical protein